MRIVLATALVLALGASRAEAQVPLAVYCSVVQDWCTLMTQEFKKKTWIKVSLVQKGSGETLAQLRAEKTNPKADLWWGGTGDPHLAAAEEDLTEPYQSPMLSKLHDWARRQADQSKFRTVGIYAGALGFAYNTEILATFLGLPFGQSGRTCVRPSLSITAP